MNLARNLRALNDWFLAKQFGMSRQLDFLDGIFLLIGDGIAPRDALRLSMNSGDPIAKHVARNMLGKLREGLPISSGMYGIFRQEVASAIAAAEQNAEFAEAGKRVIEHLREQTRAGQDIIGKLLRPLFYLAFAIGLYAMFSLLIWPRFENLASTESWHPLARFNYGIGLFFANNWYFIIAGLVAFVLGMRYLLHNWASAGRQRLDNLWPLSMYRELVAANLLEALGTLLVAGHDFRTALATVNKYSSPHVKLYLGQVRRRMRDGRNIPRAMDIGLFAKDDMSRLRMLAEFQGLRGAMVRMGSIARQEVIARLRSTATTLSTLGLGIVAISYAALVLSMYLNSSGLQSQLTP